MMPTSQPMKRHSTLRRKKSDELIECVICHRLVPLTEVGFFTVRVSPTRIGQFPVCKSCRENKTRFYIQQQLRKKNGQMQTLQGDARTLRDHSDPVS